MSFILDALKKSETERQQQSEAEFSSVPVRSSSPRAPRWLWLLIGLLVINVAAMLWLVFRPDSAELPAEAASVDRPPATTTPRSRSITAFEQQVAAARVKQPEPRAATPEPERARESQRPAPESSAPAPVIAEDLPTLIEMRASGELQLPELHLDIHVFSEVPSDRFVFINMNKHREGSTLSAGPTVSEITVDGVILEYQGRRFKLPRE